MSTLHTNTVETSSGGPVILTKQEAAKHWHQYDQIAVEVDGSLNQSSISDDATGDYTVNLTNAQSSITDRSIVGFSNHNTAETNPRLSNLRYPHTGSYTTSAISFEVGYHASSFTADDMQHNFGIIFGDLA